MTWFRPKPRGNNSPHPEQRAALFADASLHEAGDLVPDDPDTPQSRLHAALAALTVGDRERAREQLQQLLGMDEISTRLQLQAWSCLRELDEAVPAEIGGQVRGVIVDVGHAQAVATTAAFADRSAVAIHQDGEVMQWTGPDGAVDDAVETLLARGAALVVGKASGPCAQLPAAGHALISVLTFGGIHARLGSLEQLRHDGACGPLLAACERLATALAARRAPARD